MSNIQKESKFWHFMEANGPKGEKSKSNYISWLRFVADSFHPIDESINREKVEKLCLKIKKNQSERTIYKRDKDVSNIKVALHKYCKFNELAMSHIDLTYDIIAIADTEINTTQKSEIETRVGQGKYRAELIKIWGMCSLSQYTKTDFLIASHIKPWKDSSSIERVDPYNGLLLLPNIDKLFDSGYITFEDNGNIKISSLISENDCEHMSISNDMKLFNVFENNIPYLKYHRNKVFIE